MTGKYDDVRGRTWLVLTLGPIIAITTFVIFVQSDPKAWGTLAVAAGAGLLTWSGIVQLRKKRL